MVERICDLRQSALAPLLLFWQRFTHNIQPSPSEKSLRDFRSTVVFQACPELFTEINRFGRNILVEGIRQLSGMRSDDVPSLDDVVARARALKETMARQAAEKHEAEMDVGNSSSTPEVAEMDGEDIDTSQNSAIKKYYASNLFV